MPAPIILLEFDDVLAETRVPRLAALRAALALEGVHLTEALFDDACAGRSFAAAVRAAIRRPPSPASAHDETAIELASLRAERAFAVSVARGIPLARGAAAFVRGAAGAARLGIVTRTARREVEHVVSLAGLSDAFACIVAVEEYAGPEPAASPWNAAVVRMAPSGAVVARDVIALVASRHGVAAARAAGLRPLVIAPRDVALAFEGDGFLDSLQGTCVRDLGRLAAGAGAQ